MKKINILVRWACAMVVALVLTACGAAPANQTFTVTTTAIDSDGLLKKEYGASPGEADMLRSFPFAWSNLPAGTKAVALIFLDRSYSDYVHWIVTDIDPALGGLKDDDSMNAMLIQGLNDSAGGSLGYVGPLPPARHQYELTLYALSAPTNLEPRFLLFELQEAMKDKILGTATLQLPYEPGR